jgi:hypothetical protein
MDQEDGRRTGAPGTPAEEPTSVLTLARTDGHQLRLEARRGMTGMPFVSACVWTLCGGTWQPAPGRTVSLRPHEVPAVVAFLSSWLYAQYRRRGRFGHVTQRERERAARAESGDDPGPPRAA